MFLTLFLTFFLYAEGRIERTPTENVVESLLFQDDLDFLNLNQALERQLESFKNISLKGYIQYGSDVYPKKNLKDSILLFKEKVQAVISCLKKSERQICLDDFSRVVNQEFNFYRPIPKRSEPGYAFKTNRTLFTVYFSPDFIGSRTPSERFKNPIYALPSGSLKSKTREQIDFDRALDNKNLELFWVEESLFEIYILHVEGGGRVRIQNEDGTEEKVYLSYAAGNGGKFQFISKYMMDRGLLPANAAGIEAQRRFLKNNPQYEREVFASCPSYIYFKPTKDEPLGVQNIPLTEGRSLAIDTTIYPHVGVVQFVRAEHGSRQNDRVVQKPFERFFISQDTGGAIRGNARCDLYFGFGHEAETAAHNTKAMGDQFFLIKKANVN